MCGAVAKELAVRVGKVLLVNVVGYFTWKAIKNKFQGKTITGRDKPPRTDTYVDWHGNVILGTNDGMVV